MSLKRAPKVRLIDKSALSIGIANHNRAPDAWLRSPEHLAWIRTLPCAFCPPPAVLPNEACHVRKGADGATGVKPSDVFVWPGCDYHHRSQHMVGEPAFFARDNIQDPAMWAVTRYALNSPCEKTRLAAGRWMESGKVMP